MTKREQAEIEARMSLTLADPEIHGKIANLSPKDRKGFSEIVALMSRDGHEAASKFLQEMLAIEYFAEVSKVDYAEARRRRAALDSLPGWKEFVESGKENPD